jgi:hypothetical protein
MHFRGFALALLGLASIAQALPLAARQGTFTLGDPLPPSASDAIAELEVRLEYLQNQKHLSWKDRQEEGGIKALLYYVYGITSITAPDGTTTTITISTRQNTFTFGSALPDTETEALKELQVSLEQLQNKSPKTRADNELIGAIKALLFYKYGITDEYAPPGSSTTITPGKRQGTFILGGSLPSNEQEAILELEVALEQLQDKDKKTPSDYQLIGAIQSLLYYKYHITSISAPDGTTSTFEPGKRQGTFVLGGSLPSDKQEAILELEVALEQLQNKDTKTPADNQLIGAIQALLLYQYGITSISAPPGTTTTLQPGKRQDNSWTLGTSPIVISTFSSGKRDNVYDIIGSIPSDKVQAIKYLEVKLEYLQNVDKPTKAQKEAIKDIKTILYYTYHITSISAPDGTTTTLTPST